MVTGRLIVHTLFHSILSRSYSRSHSPSRSRSRDRSRSSDRSHSRDRDDSRSRSRSRSPRYRRRRSSRQEPAFIFNIEHVSIPVLPLMQVTFYRPLPVSFPFQVKDSLTATSETEVQVSFPFPIHPNGEVSTQATPATTFPPSRGG